MFEREITSDEVKQTVREGMVIESYPDDYPYPSMLKMYSTKNGPLHVVFAITDEEYVVITAYRPDPEKWESDFTKRRAQ